MVAKKRKNNTDKTDFEKNAARLQSKERALNAKSPVKPIKHRV